MIRGDTAEAARVARAIAFARERGLTADGDLGPLFDNPPAGAGADVLKLLRQMYEAGGWVLVESTLADLPADLRWLYESEAVTLEQLAAIHKALGATSVGDLASAVADGTLKRAGGVDEAVEAAIAAALPGLRAAIPRIPLGRALTATEPFLDRLETAPGVSWASPAGSLRRGEDTVRDVEIVAAAADPTAALDAVIDATDDVRWLHRSDRRLYLLADRVQVGVITPDPSNAGAVLLVRTGSIRHLDALRSRAL